MSINPFPAIKRELVARRGEDRNPGVQLFGRRFFADQTVTELLVEMLLVAASDKRIGKVSFSHPLPELDLLVDWPAKQEAANNAAPLEYAPKARLNLKLFAFLGASKLDTRHLTHRSHYKDLLNRMRGKIQTPGTTSADDVLRTLENLFLGYQGVGGQRTWCAQSFLPICGSLLAGESIWKQSGSRDVYLGEWDKALYLFTHNQRIFLARGGELLYLQLCNMLRQPASRIQEWSKEISLGVNKNETDPKHLHAALMKVLKNILNACPQAVERLAEFIDEGVDNETAHHTDSDENGQRRFTACGWCPEESWPEGYLFAIEFLRLCTAQIDPMERLELLELLCAMQVIRSLCAQSARYAGGDSQRELVAPLGYVFAISDPDGSHQALKQISRRSVSACERMIYAAMRNPQIKEIIRQQKAIDNVRSDASIYKEADSRYGYKYFLALGKRMGMIIPRRGRGARFVINERLLRLLVLTVMRPGQRITYATFKRMALVHYGMAFDDAHISAASEWSGGPPILTLGGNADQWLLEMLDSAGVLIRLSDSSAMVASPSEGIEEELA